MKKFFFSVFLMMFTVLSFAQGMTKGVFRNKELMIRMEVNLEECDIPIPGLELENCYGYIQGNINGTWAILKVKKLDGCKAVVRVISDKGDVAQDIELTFTEEGFDMKQLGDAFIKGIANRKYVKLPKVVSFVKEK